MKTNLERSLIQQKAYGTYDRNQQIKKVYTYNPHLPLRVIGEMFGLSRQRIFQITNNPFDNEPLVSSKKCYKPNLRGYLVKAIGWVKERVKRW